MIYLMIPAGWVAVSLALGWPGFFACVGHAAVLLLIACRR